MFRLPQRTSFADMFKVGYIREGLPSVPHYNNCWVCCTSLRLYPEPLCPQNPLRLGALVEIELIHTSLLNWCAQAHHCPTATTLVSISVQPPGGLHVAIAGGIGKSIARAPFSSMFVQPLDRFQVPAGCCVICGVHQYGKYHVGALWAHISYRPV